jgi:hypothetical protein
MNEMGFLLTMCGMSDRSVEIKGKTRRHGVQCGCQPKNSTCDSIQGAVSPGVDGKVQKFCPVRVDAKILPRMRKKGNVEVRDIQ